MLYQSLVKSLLDLTGSQLAFTSLFNVDPREARAKLKVAQPVQASARLFSYDSQTLYEGDGKSSIFFFVLFCFQKKTTRPHRI